MKKIAILLTVLVTLVSCSSDDSSTSTNNDPILGRWGAFKTVDESNGDIQYYVPYDGVTTYNSNGTFNQLLFGADVEGTWENLGNNIYTFSSFGFTVEGELQFNGDAEFTAYDSSFDETDYFRKLESDAELRNKIVGTWETLDSCDSSISTSNSTIVFAQSGLGQNISPDGTINQVLDISWEITNGSLYISLVDSPEDEPIATNVTFDSENEMKIEFVADNYIIQCLNRIE
jgi:hypothetical protein